MTELVEALRSRGMRLTAQRRRIVGALAGLEHGTPDAIATAVAADGGPALPLSTIYRGLDALEELGLVSHTHLDHKAPAYHLARHADHIHLVCVGCHAIDELPVQAALDFVARVQAERGFRADVTHLAIHGWCADCTEPR
ncbi:MAG: Fur family transcriptional regulator [Dermatophilaceae bacterium]